jgi:hypothetical protein
MTMDLSPRWLRGPTKTAASVPGRLIRFRCYTDYRSITGTVRTNANRLVDHLNQDDLIGLLIVEDLEVDHFDNAYYGSTVARSGIVGLADLIVAIPIEDNGPPPHNPQAWVKKKPCPVRLGVGPYELVGDVYVGEGSTVTEALATSRQRFLVVTSATILRTASPGQPVSHDIVLVNLSRLTHLHPVDDSA